MHKSYFNQVVRPEHEMLFLCARTSLSDLARERIDQLMRQGIDWEILFLFARRHSVLSLLHHSLAKCETNLIPLEFLSRIKTEYKLNAARNLLLTQELLKLLKTLEASGIEAVPFKGPALAVAAYGDLSLRRFVDLDLLIRAKDVKRAKGVLLKLGFTPFPQLTEAQESVLLRTQHNLPFALEDGRLIVEVHWEVVSSDYCAGLSADELFKNLESIELSGLKVQSLVAQTQLLALCAHGAKHYWERLAWVCDIAELIRVNKSLNWDETIEVASRASIARLLFLGLLLAKELLDCKLPAELNERINSDKVVKWLSTRAFGAVLSEEMGGIGLARGIHFNLRARSNFLSRLRYLRFAFSPTDGDLRLVALPPFLSFGYYLMRPFRLFAKN